MALRDLAVLVLLGLLCGATQGYQVPWTRLHARSALGPARARAVRLSEEPTPSESGEVYQDMSGKVVEPPPATPPPTEPGTKPQTDMPVPEFPGITKLVPGWLLTFGGAALLGAMPSLIKSLGL